MKNVNTQCAFAHNGTCLATIQTTCEGCGFCKTPFELATSKQAAYKRLRTLDRENQLYISQTYFSGARPWDRG